MNRKQRRAAAKLGQTSGNPPGETAAPVVPTGAAALLGEGVKHHQKGRLSEAEACYRRVLTAQPDHPDALHLLGVVAHQAGRHDLAVELIGRAIRRNGLNPFYFFNLGNALTSRGEFGEAVAAFGEAVRIKPDYAEAHSNLGAALTNRGKLDEAVAAYRWAIRLKPDFAEVHSNLGTALTNQGKLDEAVASCRRAIVIKPDYAEAHCSLGTALQNQGKLDEAVAAYRRAIVVKPDYAEAHFNLGTALMNQSKLDEAIAADGRAIRLKPDRAEAHSNLGNALTKRGKFDEAVAAYLRAIRLEPDFAGAHYNLGTALTNQGKLDEAVAAYRRAIGIKPDYAAALSSLGTALQNQGKLDEAIAAYGRAIRLEPDLAEAHSNLGNTLTNQGKLDEAIATYRRAIGIKPDMADAHSGLLFCLNNHAEVTADQLFAEHRKWGARFGRQALRPTAYANGREAGRRLRIGYVSPDFRLHSVAYFVEPLLHGHDRQAVEVFCYAEVLQPDIVTARLQGLADRWRVTVGLSDDELTEHIRADSIDILVDLAGHTAKNRLGVFARKPAPVQVTWLGYPSTTGLDAIDYRLVDAVTDPTGEADTQANETLVRLEGGFLCYGGVEGAPEPAVPPCQKNGTVTFGSFNNASKVSAATLDAWATLLARLPEAHLLLKAVQFGDATTRALFLARLGERGVAAERVELVAWLPAATAHLAIYHQVDIALDPFPYNGATTTCEALWMGVPVVTLRGNRHAGRVGASLLSQVGLTDLIADSVEEYVEIAVALAGDRGRLDDLRRSLRRRVAASPLCDGGAFARKIEAAFRHMWRQWCEAPDNQ